MLSGHFVCFRVGLWFGMVGGLAQFSPSFGASDVSLNMSKILVKFDHKISLSSHNSQLTFLGISTAVLHLPWVAQKLEVFNYEGSLKYNYQEMRTSRDGLGQPAVVIREIDQHAAAGLLEVSNDLLILNFPRPLKPETQYTLQFDDNLLTPPANAGALKFATQKYTRDQPENWSEQCDPWKNRVMDLQADYSLLGAWDLCPLHLRSMSGCGDFVDDTREVECMKAIDVSQCKLAERQIFHEPQSIHDLQYLHVCFNQRITLGDQRALYSREWALPPSTTAHRNVWGKWGEYTYLPSERWVHNVEHGGVAFLYDSCMSETALQIYRKFVYSLSGDAGGPFRFVLTPYRLNHGQFFLMLYPFMVVTYGYVFASHCFSFGEITSFILSHYRSSVEDFPGGGNYDHLWTQPAYSISAYTTRATDGTAALIIVSVAAAAIALTAKSRRAFQLV